MHIHITEYNIISNVKETPLFDKKKKAEAQLSCFKIKLWNYMIVQAHKQHFWKADTLTFDAQFTATAAAHTVTSNTHSAKLIKYNISEWAKVIWLICSSSDGLSNWEMLQQRIQTIKVRAALCNQQKTQCCSQLKFTVKQEKLKGAVNESEKNANDDFSIVCWLTQSLFCLSDKRLSYQDWVYEYIKSNKMMNEVKKHLKNYTLKNQILCLHSQCKAAELILLSVMSFKNHTVTVHKIFLHV